MIAGACAVAVALYACLGGHTTTPGAITPVAPSSSQAGSATTLAATEPVVVAETLRLDGLVVDTADKPVAGATVRLADRVAITEADGSFAFDATAAGTYSLSAQADELYGEVDDRRFDDTTDPIEITIRGGPSVVLHVRDATGAPIANAKASTSARQGFTDRDGTTTLRSIDEGLELITVSAPGYADVELRVDAGGPVVVERTVTLHTGATISGIVLGPDDKPAPDARVEIGGMHSTIVATTDADGHWQLDDIPGGAHQITASSTRCLAAEPLVITTDGVHVERDIIVHVRAAAEITGIVVDAAGAPVDGASVSGSGSRADSDAHGRFTLVGLDAGTTDVAATTPRGATRPVSVELAAGGHADVRLVIVTSSLAGVLRDARGNPIGQAALAASSAADSHVVHTDEHGYFDFGGVVPGDYEISVRRPHRKRGFANVKTVTADNRDLVIVLPDAVTLTGRVIANGKPATTAGIVVTDSPDDDRSTPSMVDPKTGRFVVDDLEAGSWGVIAGAPGFALRRVATMPAAAGAHLDFGDIVLDPGRTIRGCVIDDTGRPVAMARVAVYVTQSASEGLVGVFEGSLTTTTDAGGNYVLSGTESHADARIVATHPTAGVSTDRVLGAGESQVDLVLAASGSIAGTIENMSVGQSGVIASFATDPDLRAVTDIDPAGGFRLDGLHPGDYQLVVYGNNKLAPQRVTVGAGQTTMVVFTMDPSH
ncbi:MAG TPA: carboxypeptidase-like regulatory domain-containing protein [Kofleriaceae bacterium]|nr:carboxypeptidase-like regulatory domain-containing protein [Kofleriaceae bacterium]